MKNESSSVPTLIFFTTLGCHLCEQAEHMMTLIQRQFELNWQSIDISDDPLLVEQYGIRIPVLKNAVTGDELGWPFAMHELHQFLALDPGRDS